MRKISFLVPVSLLLLAQLPAWGLTWYVDGSVSPSGDGKAWATAFKKIREGIDEASDADTIIASQGTYLESIKFNGKKIVLTSTDPLHPTVVANTTIDGNEAASLATFAGTEKETRVLSGFTIRNAKADYGGGVSGGSSNKHTVTTMEGNTITGNPAQWDGGGLQWSNGTIRNNSMSASSAEAHGGGLDWRRAIMRNNRITERRPSCVLDEQGRYYRDCWFWRSPHLPSLCWPTPTLTPGMLALMAMTSPGSALRSALGALSSTLLA